jgi:tol-pal system protein YbgF
MVRMSRFDNLSIRWRTGSLRARLALLGCFLILGIPGTTFPLLAQDAAEFLLRLDRLETENRRLNGQVEELRFQLKRVEDQLKRSQLDQDSRFRDLEGNRGAIRPAPSTGGAIPQPNLAVPTPTPVTPPTTQRRSDAFDPSLAGSAPGAPRPLGSSAGVATAPGMPLAAGTVPPGGQVVEGGDLGTPLDVTGQRRVAPPGPDPLPRGDARSDFEFARTLLTRGDLEQAEGAFRDYLRSYPRDRRVPEVTFLLGETYLRRTRYREAAENFLTVTSKFSASPRAPEAMVKLGMSLRGLGAKEEACATFDQVGKKFPNASTGIKQAVDREKGRAQC